MRERWTKIVVVLAAGVLLVAARGQEESGLAGEPGVQQYEDYLERMGLKEVLAAHLRERVRVGSGETRFRVAERLGVLYVEMLGDAQTPQERVGIEDRARELLKLVPESETFELRINLAKVSYLAGEEIAERDRLRLVTPGERSEAVRLLRGVATTFEDVARKVQSQIDSLERQERGATDDVAPRIREELATASRVRSLARYYMGWSSYYLALLGANSEGAGTFDTGKALENFGWILQAAPGRAPSVGQLPKSLLRYEHVGRAAIGAALTVGLKGNDVEAIRWLDEIESVEDLNPAVRAQLFTRRLIVYAGADRWADAEALIRRARQPNLAQAATPLSPAEARLTAVLALEATRNAKSGTATLDAAERVAQTGMADLVARGEVSQIVDLVERYGTAPIGDTGFVVQYVQGLQVYEKARERQKASGEAPDGPATTPDLVNSYRQAAELLRVALGSADVGKFEAEAGRALMRRGFALYYAGDLEEASASFQKSHEAGVTVEQKRDALWYAIVALDRAVDGGKVSLGKERDRLAVLYLQQYPDTEDAAKLLLRQAQAELLGDEATLKILTAVTPEQPLYEAARRQAARVLYRVYRKASAADKVYAAGRFADVAEEMLRAETRKAAADRGEEGTRAAQNVLLLVRQLSDALLAGPSPDVKRVEAALQLLEGVAAMHRLDLSPLDAELAFRRLQVAIGKDDPGEIERCVLRLRQNTGEFALAGERLLYRRALSRWGASPEDVESAKQVVRHGRTVLENAPGSAEASLVSIRVKVAEAAAKVWVGEKDEAMRRLALEYDAESVRSGGKTEAVLRRLAVMSEEAGDTATALSSWQQLFNALPVGEPDWYEARYESLRLLWKTDQAAATAVMAQFKALQPRFGPEPWRTKLIDLEREMRAGAAVPTGPAPAMGGGP